MPQRRIPSVLSALLLLAALAACGGGGGMRASSTPGGEAPAITVERFLRLASQREYAAMGQVFGTVQGAISQRDPVNEVERRMFAIASVLQNRGFSIRDTSPIPGRPEAVQVMVRLQSRTGDSDVPFTVVRGPSSRWFVEIVDLERVTRVRSR